MHLLMQLDGFLDGGDRPSWRMVRTDENARTDVVAGILDTLAARGQAHRLDDGRYTR